MRTSEELRGSSDSQLRLLRDRAWQIHQLRGATLQTVSRSTLLYSAVTISPLVLTVLEISGLDVRAWERELGFDQRPALGDAAPAGDRFQLHDDTDQALDDYSSFWPKRPLDILGAVGTVIQTISGKAKGHLESAGLNVVESTTQLTELVNATDPDGLVDYTKLNYEQSARAEAIFDAARAINRQFNVEYRALTASQIAIAAAALSDKGNETAPSFLQTYIDEQSAKSFGNVISKWMGWYRKGSTPNYDRWTQTLTAIVMRAQHVTQQSRKESTVAARHLIGALIASDLWAANSGVPALFAEAGIDQRKLARVYLEEYLSKSPADPTQPARDDLDVWRRFLGFSSDSFVPRFNSEDLAGEDHLDVMVTVDAFASLAASNRIEPPLSIGLFGDWGSGKSFFMSKMREAIAERAQRAAGRANSVFYERIVQIDFNAWHYVEANLWASMVDHLFRNLKLTYEKAGDASVNARREELLRKLDTLMQEKVTAEENVAKAEIERDRATQELDAKKKAADASAAAARNVRAKDVWELVIVGQTERDELQNALKQLGVGSVLASVTDVRTTVDELRSIRTRTTLLVNWIVRQPKSLVLLFVLLVLAPFLAMAITAVARHFAPEVAAVGKSLAEVASFLCAIAAWLAKRLSSGKKILDSVDTARAKIDTHIQVAEKAIQQDITSSDKALADAADAVTKAQKEVVNREQGVLEAKNELLKLTNGYRLNRFIDERAASDDYRKLLGVLATVRNDFSTLSELMHPKSGKSDIEDELRIERIVLYIDDLDRCDPDRVIEVLQAVHLLLAFKLFVVVVGVDARWVSESLRQKHRALRGRNDRPHDDDDDVAGYAAEPHDYLEKIFQVPFWLDPLEPAKAGRYIGNLLAGDLPDSSTQTQSGPAPTPRLTAAEQSEEAPLQTQEVLHTMGAADDENDPNELKIDPKERLYMMSETMARLVSRSPRTAKRFVNTYRFFRAGMPRETLTPYLAQGTPAEYRCALLMLAIVVGAPDISPELFEQMRAAPDPKQRLHLFVGSVVIADDDAAEWKVVRDALRDFGESESAALSHLLPYIDRVSRYSFRPPNKLRRKRPRQSRGI